MLSRKSQEHDELGDMRTKESVCVRLLGAPTPACRASGVLAAQMQETHHMLVSPYMQGPLVLILSIAHVLSRVYNRRWAM